MSKFICQITIPITNYNGDGVYEKQIYFECENQSPTKEQVINVLEKEHQNNLQYSDYHYCEEEEASKITKLISDDEWRFISPNYIVMKSTFVEHPRFGKHSYSWKIIKPYCV